VGATPVQEIATVTADGVTAITKAYTSNVATGNLLAITCGRFNATQVAFTAADCTLSAGTATLGTIALDAHAEATPTEAIESGVWSAPVTAGGSATIRIAGSTGAYFELNVNEYSSVDVSGTRVAGTPTSGSSNTGTSPATAAGVTTSSDSLFIGAVATDYAGTNLAPAAGNSFTLIGSSVNGSLHQTGASVRKIVTGASTDSLSVSLATTSLNGWCACLVAYKAAAAVTVDAPRFANPMRPTATRVIGRTALALRSVRPPQQTASGAAPVTFTPSAAVSTWTAPDPVLTPGGVSLVPTAAVSTWVAGTATLTVGPLSLSPAAAATSWTAPTPSLSVAGVTLSPSAASSTWTVPTPVLSAGPLTLTPTAPGATWNAGTATLSAGPVTLSPSAALSTWNAGSASLSGGSNLTPTAAVSTWHAGVATLSVGPLTLAPSAASSAWTANAPALGVGGVTLSPSAPHASWTVPAAVLSVGPLSLSPAASTQTWNVPSPVFTAGPVTLATTAAVAVWHVLAATFGPTVPLDWIVVGLFVDVGPRVALAAADPRVALFDAAPIAALYNRAPTVALSPLEFP
jgi:hypothetical protein